MSRGATPISVTRHDSDLGSWERAWCRPGRHLVGVVEGYCGYHQRMAAPATHRGIPGPTLPLVISLGPSQVIGWDAASPRAVEVTSFVSGIHDRYVMIDAEEHHGIQVELSPVAAIRLLGRPLRELANEVVPLDAVLGRDAARLVDDLATARSWSARFRMLDAAMARRLALGHEQTPELPPELSRAWAVIAASRGQVRVGKLADELGWSPRRLRARFTDTFGVAPKRMARLTRFAHAAALLSRADGPPLAAIAASAGFADQAHLTNEVTSYSGLSPSALRASNLPGGGGVFEPVEDRR